MSLLKLIYSDLRNSGSGKSFISSIIKILFNVNFQILSIYRVSHALVKTPLRILTLPLGWWQKVMYGCDISPFAKIGSNFSMLHPLGIVIGQNVEIGDNVKIWQQVTIGSHGKPNEPLSYPIIENNVKIFAGAKVFGNIKIGENSLIGANAVVNKDIPPNSVAVGIPAKVKRRDIEQNE